MHSDFSIILQIHYTQNSAAPFKKLSLHGFHTFHSNKKNCLSRFWSLEVGDRRWGSKKYICGRVNCSFSKVTDATIELSEPLIRFNYQLKLLASCEFFNLLKTVVLNFNCLFWDGNLNSIFYRRHRSERSIEWLHWRFRYCAIPRRQQASIFD